MVEQMRVWRGMGTVTNARQIWNEAENGTAFITHWSSQGVDEPDVVWVKGPEFGGVNTLDWDELEWLIPVNIAHEKKVFS